MGDHRGWAQPASLSDGHRQPVFYRHAADSRRHEDISTQLNAAAPSLTNVCPNSNLSLVGCGVGTGLLTETNNTPNLSQAVLNLVNGTGATVTNVSGGIVRVDASGGGNCTLDSVVPGEITASNLDVAGIGYTNGDTGYLFGGNNDATYVITNAIGGVVQPGGYTITAAGTYYSVSTYAGSATSGSGAGMQIDVTAVSTGSSGEFLYNNAGACAGGQFWYSTAKRRSHDQWRVE